MESKNKDFEAFTDLCDNCGKQVDFCGENGCDSDVDLDCDKTSIIEKYITTDYIFRTYYAINGSQNIADYFLEIMSDRKGLYDEVRFEYYRQLSTKCRLFLNKSVDLIYNFSVQILPGETLRRATLFCAVQVRKDAGEDVDNSWLFDSSKYTMEYMPLKTIDYPDYRSFSFFENPIAAGLLPYRQLSIQIDIENRVEYSNRRWIKLDSSLLYNDKNRSELMNVQCSRDSSFGKVVEEYLKSKGLN